MSTAQIKESIKELDFVIQKATREKNLRLIELKKIEKKDAVLVHEKTIMDVLEFFQKIKNKGGLVVPHFNSSNKVWIEFLTDNPYIVKLSISILQAT